MSDIKDFCTFCDPNTEDKNKIKGYSIQDFAHLVIESENQS